MTEARNRSGMSLLEYLIAVSLLSLVVGSLLSSSRDMVRSRTSLNTRTRLQQMGENALAEIMGDLRLSGFVPGTGGVPDYPVLAPGAITFLLPADEDEDGVPDLDIDGSLIFDSSDFGFVLTTEPGEAVGRIERWVDGSAARVVATDVEQLVFLGTGDDPAIPLDAIAVRIAFRGLDRTGVAHTHEVETLVRLRNTQNN